MGFGSTAKKLQSVVDMADELYSKIGDLREQMNAMRETIETTNERVGAIEAELDDQRAILEALAKAEDVEIPTDVVDDGGGIESEETDVDEGEISGDESESTDESASADES